jgi:hypothetical protein
MVTMAPGAWAPMPDHPHCAGWTYALETGFLEMLLQSGHRTLDPEQAGERGKGHCIVGEPRQEQGCLCHRPVTPSVLLPACPCVLQTTFTCPYSHPASYTPSGEQGRG